MKNNVNSFQFPCLYPLKTIGRNTNEFYAVVNAIIEKYIPEGEQVTYRTRRSSDGKYLSVTAIFSAQSQEHLNTIYQELGRHELVLTSL